MARITELKKIQKYHTEDEMRQALQDFINGKHRLHIPVDDDDPDVVLADTINELLEAREFSQKLLSLIEQGNDKIEKATSETYAVDWMTVLLENIEKLCKEHVEHQSS